MQQAFDPDREEEYWRKNFRDRPYVRGASYDQFGPAYAYGIFSYEGHAARGFDDAEGDLIRGWNDARETSSLSWSQAKHAVKDAWDRLTQTSGPERARSGQGQDTGVRS
jgi:hypothetical protein